jgi:phage-related protein
MHGIKFGTYHTYTAWGLFLKHWEITPPAPRRRTVIIPGKHGALDVSTALTGNVEYENRTLTATFIMLDARENWADKYSRILNAIHGRTLLIYPDDDPDYCYKGFVEVQSFDPESTMGTFLIKADCCPYKIERAGTGEKL